MGIDALGKSLVSCFIFAIYKYKDDTSMNVIAKEAQSSQ